MTVPLEENVKLRAGDPTSLDDLADEPVAH